LIFEKTLPEGYYRFFRENPEAEMYYTKRKGVWESLTRRQGFEFILKTMAGLKRLGFQRGQRVSILADNRYEWVLTDYAVQWMGGVVTAIYTTSSSDQIQYILNESNCSILFLASSESLKRLSSVKDLQTLKTIVAWDRVEGAVPQGTTFLARDAFYKEAMSEEEAQSLLSALNPEDLCVLLYTSGTTGEPKGVMLNHRNFTSNIEMLYKAIRLESRLVCLSFLPLSHIYERTVHNYILLAGIKIYFAESMEKLLENFSEAKPHVNLAVPRIFEKMYAKVMEKVKSAPFIRKRIFFVALRIGKKVAAYKMDLRPVPLRWRSLNAVAEVLVFRKIRAITGGRARVFISGGAPLSAEIASFFFSVGFTIYEGYGLSETCIVSVNRPGKIRFGSVGIPLDGLEIKRAEDGEILVRGPNIMMGYYRKAEETAEVIDREGWFHTGDIGELDDEGFLRITDRKKDLIVLAAGKKVAPQPIENALKADPLIELACLVGDKRNFISLLITPNLEFCQGWAHSKGFNFSSLKDCAENEKLRERYQRKIDEVNATLPRYSTIKEFRVLPNSFTLEGGEVTPTLKLKRRIIQDKYSAIIDSMYANQSKLD
jgi:long-chain acyl-CoA synthetase